MAMAPWTKGLGTVAYQRILLVCICKCICICMCMCMRKCVYMCMCMCIHVYVNIYILLYIYIIYICILYIYVYTSRDCKNEGDSVTAYGTMGPNLGRRGRILWQDIIVMYSTYSNSNVIYYSNVHYIIVMWQKVIHAHSEKWMKDDL